jgi:hypothetical protein
VGTSNTASLVVNYRLTGDSIITEMFMSERNKKSDVELSVNEWEIEVNYRDLVRSAQYLTTTWTIGFHMLT